MAIGTDDIQQGNAGSVDGVIDGNKGSAGTSELDAIAARNSIDPAEARNAASGGPVGEPPAPGKRGRGRPRKDGTTKSTSNPSPLKIDPSAVAGAKEIILLVHQSLVAMKIPEAEISEEEAEQVAIAWRRFVRWHPKLDFVLSEKSADHIALVRVAGSVYGTRLSAAAIRIRMQREAAQAPTVDGDGTVIDMTGRFSGPSKPN